MDENQLSNKVIGAAIEVHRQIGPGLLENIYLKCLVYELEQLGVQAKTEVTLPIQYKHLEFKEGYRADLVVEDKLIVELKAVETMLPVFNAQLLSYLKMSGLRLGLLINFNVPHLRDGIKRIVNKL
ncbi:MAG: GxxExxY protein [Pseudomonadota bacterium]